MPQHKTRMSWTEADIARLKSLSGQGASVFRAAAALNRTVTAVKAASRIYGLGLVKTRQLKAAVRDLDRQASSNTRF